MIPHPSDLTGLHTPAPPIYSARFLIKEDAGDGPTLTSHLCGSTYAALCFPRFKRKDAVRLVVPFPAGGGGDTLARSVTTALAAALKTSLWVDNRPGAGGTVGTRHVAQDKKDGSVLGYVTNGILCVNSLLYPNLKFDPAKELIPVGRISEIGMVAVLNPRAIARGH